MAHKMKQKRHCHMIDMNVDGGGVVGCSTGKLVENETMRWAADT